MGRFSVEVQLANNEDLIYAQGGSLEPDKVRRVTVTGVVDSGATRLVLPKSVADELGLRPRRKVRVRYADGRRRLRNEVGGVHLTLQGRDDVFSAVVEPKRDTALIGAIVLEDLDFLVDCIGQKLTPRDPDFIVNEIE
ncbi:MAG: retroviral-like aspartic protease family protein [Gemmataceae bacterium]|nr:retroviral-like aspartic protease family protein [Gemmataceae bacterium]